MKAKEVLIQRYTFLKLQINHVEPPVIFFGLAHTKIHEEVIGQVVIIPAASKAFGLNKINF